MIETLEFLLGAIALPFYGLMLLNATVGDYFARRRYGLARRTR